jgi:hypothetical protein
MITLTKTTSYKDGGTEAYLLGDNLNQFNKNGLVFCCDNRLFSSTKGCWYEGYPEKNNGNLVAPESELALALDSAHSKLLKKKQQPS